MNDAAYFVLLFAQVEQTISAEYEQIVGHSATTPFVHRLRMVRAPLDADALLPLYQRRNDIAHGRLAGFEPINLPAEARLLRRYID